ncbi:MAG: response regulator transcription factor [Oscillospiraceae bacterium]|nr:response regulator transcription factor [Oscillospiraceae bacterium]
MKRILVLEDEAAIREFIVINLQRGGYEVVQAEDGAQALAEYAAAEGNFDVALLDIMVPEIDGLEVCKQLRAQSAKIGIIMLTAKAQEMDKLNGLMNGADDYITKPFSPSELSARVDAVYRRVALNDEAERRSTSHILHAGKDFTLDLRSHTLTRHSSKDGQIVNENIDLTQLEFQLMEYFFTNIGAALSRTDILERVWGTNYIGEEKIVDVNIRRLRMKLEKTPSNPQYLTTVWGRGYKWVTDGK